VNDDGSSADPSTGCLGIAVITYKRPDRLRRLVDAIVALTGGRYRLLIADDGGGDGGGEWCRANGHMVVTGRNRGVAWNKNRGLFALSALGCDPLLLVEDDVYPTTAGWERDWIEATRAWHHLGYYHRKIVHCTVSGQGTPLDPYVNTSATAQCLSVSAEVMEKVGFFDSRFKGWGHEHAEWTTRIKRAGYGYKVVTLPDGRRPKAQLYLSGGLASDDAPSFRDEEQVRHNRQVAEQLIGQSLFRRPWRDEDERSEFLAEQAVAGIDGSALVRRIEEAWGRGWS
jgi:glycosyltransferase involved in cell wall biosynthesis